MRVERVLDIDESRETAALLRLSNDGEREGGLPGGFWPENFHHASPRKTAHAEGAIDQDVASGNDVDVDNGSIAEAHDRAVAVVFRDLLNRQVEVLVAGSDDFVFAGCFFFGFRSHRGAPLVRAVPDFAK